MNLNKVLLKELKEEMNTTRRFLESISEDLFSYTPHEKSKAFGQLVNHILPIPSWISVITQNTELDWSKATPPAALKSKEDILKQFEVNVSIGKKSFKSNKQ